MLRTSAHPENNRFFCQKIGKGPNLLIALHGFSKSSAVFQKLEQKIGKTYTILAIDLPFHGKTLWEENHYTQKDLSLFIEELLLQYGASQFSLMGHSLGGRIALTLAPAFSGRLAHLCLLAPDGLSTRRMTVPEILPLSVRKIIAKRLHQPAPLLKLAKVLHQIHLLDGFTIKYLNYHLDDPKRRDRLLKTWVSLVDFKVGKQQLLTLSKMNPQLRMVLVLGKKDPLIRVKSLQKKLRGNPNLEIKVLDQGHHLIGKELAEILLDLA